jgi:hypothetical protein
MRTVCAFLGDAAVMRQLVSKIMSLLLPLGHSMTHLLELSQLGHGVTQQATQQLTEWRWFKRSNRLGFVFQGSRGQGSLKTGWPFKGVFQ